MQVNFHFSHLIQLAMLLTSSWIFASCIDTFDAELPSSETTYIVVEGSICGESDCSFSLSRSMSLNPSYGDILGRYINNATVTVCGSDNARYQAKIVSEGTYKAQVGNLKPDQEYWLEIQWEGHTFTSTPARPLPTPEIKSLTYEQKQEKLPVDILVTPAAPENNEIQYFIWNYVEDWEIQTPYNPRWEYDAEEDQVVSRTVDLHRGWCNSKYHTSIIGENTNYTNGEIRNLHLYTIDYTDNRFNYLYCTTIIQRAVSREEYEYERLSQRQSDDMGGLFTPQPSALPTNIHCTDGGAKAIGYVGVTLSAKQARLFIKGSDVGYRILKYPEKPTEDQLKLTPAELYQLEFRVSDYNDLTNEITWIQRWGVDCTVWGASLTAPDFWPNKQPLGNSN